MAPGAPAGLSLNKEQAGSWPDPDIGWPDRRRLVKTQEGGRAERWDCRSAHFRPEVSSYPKNAMSFLSKKSSCSATQWPQGVGSALAGDGVS